MFIQSLPFNILLFCFSSYCAANRPASWTNSSSILPTRVSNSRAIPGVNIKPPLSLLTGSRYASSYTGTPEYNYFTGITSYASTTYGPAVFNHTTFQSVCPSSPASSARACYSTCISFANACRELHSAWSGRNVAYQSSMNEKHFGGSSSRIGDVVWTHTEQLTTIWSYDTSWATSLTTVDILRQFGESQKVYPTIIHTMIDGVSTSLTSTATQSAVQVQTESQAYAIGGTGDVVSVKTLDNYLFTSTQYYSWSFSEPKPQCSPTTWTDCQFRTDCDKCTISGGTVRLLYFPVSRTSSGGIHTTNAPVTSKDASPKTAIYGNTTLTSPSVYISFHTAYAMNACGTQIGQRYPGAILALNPNSLSSVNMIWGTMYSTQAADPFASGSPYLIASSFNLADMNWPVPASAYMAQPKCQNGAPFGLCSVIVDDYNPLLEVPDEIRAMDPAWRACELDWQGLYDPPTALQPAEAMAKPTLSSDPGEGYTSARPQSTPTSPPVQTTVPDATMQFTTPDSAQSSSTQNSAQNGQDPTSAVEDPTTATKSKQPNVENTAASSEASVVAFSGSDPTAEIAQSGTIIDPTNVSDGAPSVSKEGNTNPSETIGETNASPSTSVNPTATPQGEFGVGEDTSTVSKTQSLPAIVTPSAQPGPGASYVAASEAVNDPAPKTESSFQSSSSKIGTVFVDNTGGANVIFGGSTIAAGQLSTEAGDNGPTMFIGSESGTLLTRTLQSLQPASTSPGGQEQPAKPGSGRPNHSVEAAPLMVAIDSQTLTEGGPAQTVSGQVASLASNEIVIGSQTISIPQIEAGTQHISLPVGSNSALMGMTFIAGEVTKTARHSAHRGAKATPASASSNVASTSGFPRAIFTFGTHTYTAIKTAGPSQAVVDGKTLSIGGPQVTLDGGNVSLNSDGQLALHRSPTTASTSTSTNDAGVAKAATITLEGTTLTAVHMSTARKGVLEVGDTTLSPGGSDLVIGNATISALSRGRIVTLGDGGSGTVTLRRTSESSVTSPVNNEPLSPSVTSGVGYVQTAEPSATSTSAASMLATCGQAIGAALLALATLLQLSCI